MLQCKLKLSVARITTCVANSSRNKIPCCKLQQHVARSRTLFYFWQQLYATRNTELCCVRSCLRGGNTGNKVLQLAQQQCCKEILPVLPDLNVSPPTSENRILNYGFSKESIHKVYTLPFLITKDSKLIAFQYKIIHHILPTKSSLFRAGITDSDICSLCATEKQTIIKPPTVPLYCI